MNSLALNTSFKLDLGVNILQEVLALNPSHSHLSVDEYYKIPAYQKIKALIRYNKPIHFILPAFPAKSPNREKTLSSLPDYGELIALQKLNTICENIQNIYTPGAYVTICSDGRVFNDVVGVSDEDLASYKTSIKALSEKKFTHLKHYCLDDAYPMLTNEERRTTLINTFAPSIEQIKKLIAEDSSQKLMFNGMHRFLKDDLVAKYPEKSKNFVSEKAKEATYEVMRRSKAWDALLSTVFDDVVRLSIHPYPLENAKFSIQFLSGDNHWATPWHNVVLKINHQLVLVKHKIAKELGASLKFFEGSYGYYEI